MTTMERATVAVFGLLLAGIFGVLLAWIFLVTEGKPGASAKKIEILRVVPVLTDTQDRFMLIDGTDKREGYWINPETGERVKILTSRPVPIVIPWAHFTLADEHRP